MAKRKKNADEHDEVRAEVIEAMKNKSPSDREKRIVLLWQRWEEAKAYLAKVRSETRKSVEEARAYLKEHMESGVAVNDNEASLRKLASIETCWQDLEEAKAQQRDGVGGARDGVKAAYETLKEAIVATKQLGFEFNEDGMEAVRVDEPDENGQLPLDDEEAASEED